MGGLTNEKPKPLLEAHGKTLLEWKLDALPSSVKEVIIVIGYLGDKIKSFFGSSYSGRSIKYVDQKELLGTGHALWQTQSLINDKFIVLMGDDIYHADDLAKLAEAEYGMLFNVEKNLSSGGILQIKNEIVIGIDETGGKNITEGALYTGACVLSPDIFSLPLQPVRPGSKEYCLPQTILQPSRNFSVNAIQATSWIRITNPEDLSNFEKSLEK